MNDIRRIVRALEVYEKTGRPLSDWHSDNRKQKSVEHESDAYYCLTYERETLNNRINDRVNMMMQQGFREEVESLRAAGYGSDLNSMRSIGYRQMNECLDGLMTVDEAIENIQLETRQFARRQLIWFRADKRLRWIHADGLTVSDIVEEICTSANKQTNQHN